MRTSSGRVSVRVLQPPRHLPASSPAKAAATRTTTTSARTSASRSHVRTGPTGARRATRSVLGSPGIYPPREEVLPMARRFGVSVGLTGDPTQNKELIKRIQIAEEVVVEAVFTAEIWGCD